MSQEHDIIRGYVIDPQGPSVRESDLTYERALEACGGPLEITGLRAATDDSHAIELWAGDPSGYPTDCTFELEGVRYVGTACVVARNEDGELVDADVSVKWVRDRVKFPGQ